MAGVQPLQTLGDKAFLPPFAQLSSFMRRQQLAAESGYDDCGRAREALRGADGDRAELVEDFRSIGKGQGGWRDDLLNYYRSDAGI